MNKILMGDCIEIMSGMPDESVNCIVTDPPYLMNYQSGRRAEKLKKIEGDTPEFGERLIMDFVKESKRILKDDSALFVFCSWHKVDFFKQQIEKEFKVRNIIVWNKNNHGSGDLTGGFAPKHEFCIFAVKGNPKLQAERLPDVLDIDRVDVNSMVHPTQKPVMLFQLLIKQFTKEGDVVLDCFAGSGTCAIACLNTRRNYICIEKDPEYYNIAMNRVDDRLWDLTCR